MQVSYTTQDLKQFQNTKKDYDLIEITRGNTTSFSDDTEWKSHLSIGIGNRNLIEALKTISRSFNANSHKLSNVLVAQGIGVSDYAIGVAHGIAQGMEQDIVYKIQDGKQLPSLIPATSMDIIRIKNIVANSIRSSAMY